MQNPFTTTFSKMPEYTYISTEEELEILENFSYESPSESVYKITGVRGSGKTVTLAKIEESISSNEFSRKGWLVYRLSPSRDLIQQLAAKLYKEPFIKTKNKNKNININAQILGTGGGLGFSTQTDNSLFDIGIEIDEMMSAVIKAQKKILIGIDEVSKTREMIIFASEFAKWLRAGYPIYLVCTGLYENITELANVKNLTFFRRATTIATTPLNYVKMCELYKKLLKVESDQAKEMASSTKGYAYAFQQLGMLYFKKKESDTLDDVLGDLKSELFAYSYEKIWEELTDAERNLLKLITKKNEYKRSEVIELMGNSASGYSTYRDRLRKKGIIKTRQSYISLALPFFGEYVKEYC